MPRRQPEWTEPKYLEPFKGRWVAVRAEQVQAWGESPEHVRAKLKHLRKTADDVFLVPGTAPRWCGKKKVTE